MSPLATEKQIAHIIKLTALSPIPPIYQETLLNALHALSAEDASHIERHLEQLEEKLAAYEKATVAWIEAWQTIAQRIDSRLKREVMLLEHEVDEALRNGQCVLSAIDTNV